MEEEQVRELFREVMHIGNKFDVSLKPFRIIRALTLEELGGLLDSWEYKHFKKNCPNLAQGVEEYFTDLGRVNE